MSIVSNFVRSMHTQAAAMIGQEEVVIGARSIPCILSEVDDSKDFATGGFETVKRLTAVCPTSSLPPTSILKKIVTARGQTFRVEGVSMGADFATITLEQVEKA
jgi:hypothetical protein